MAGASYGGELLENPSLLARPITIILLAVTFTPAAVMAIAYLATGSREFLLGLALASAPLPVDLLVIYGLVVPAVERLVGLARLLLSTYNATVYGIVGRIGGLVVSARLPDGSLMLAVLDTKTAKIVLVRSPVIVGELGGIPRAGRVYRVKWPVKPKPAVFQCRMWTGKLNDTIIMPHPESPILVKVEGDMVGGYIACPELIEDELLKLLNTLKHAEKG